MSQPENLDNPMVLLRRLHRWRMAFFGVVILIAGLTIGASTALLTLRYAGPDSRGSAGTLATPLWDRIVPRLHLSREQAQKVEPILRKHMQRLEEIREQGRSQIAEELEAMDEQMATVLSPEQVRLWRELVRSLPGQLQRGQGRFGSRGGGGGGGPGRLRRSSDGVPTSPNDVVVPH